MITLKANQNLKLSKFLQVNKVDISYSVLNKLLRNKDIKVNGARISKDIELSVGDVVEIYYTVQPKPLTVIFKDDNILVAYKPKGIEAVDFYEQVKAEYSSAQFVHRLDRNTDGVMIFPLNQVSESELLLGFKEHRFIKKYVATVIGSLPKKSDILCDYLFKDSKKSIVKIYKNFVTGSLPIKTGYKVIEEKDGLSKLEVTLYTGRTHQIRAHLAFIGHAILGDGKYGDNRVNKQYKVNKQMLTAVSITLNFNKESPLYYLNGKSFFVKG